MTTHLEDLALLNARELQALFNKALKPDWEALVDYEFRGFNEPKITKLLGFQKFKKGFYQRDGLRCGYNIPVEQGPLAAPWVCKPSDAEPKRFGFFSVLPIEDLAAGYQERESLLLNYADGRNSLFEGKFLRDYVRQVEPENESLYLGKAYSEVAGRQIMPTFFIIERHRKAPAGAERI